MEKYIIVEHREVEEFKKIVNQKIKDGYIPLGGVTVYDLYYIQALIVRELEQI